MTLTLPLPAELEVLRELHDKVVAQMTTHNVARQPRTKRQKRLRGQSAQSFSGAGSVDAHAQQPHLPDKITAPWCVRGPPYVLVRRLMDTVAQRRDRAVPGRVTLR